MTEWVGVSWVMGGRGVWRCGELRSFTELCLFLSLFIQIVNGLVQSCFLQKKTTATIDIKKEIIIIINLVIFILLLLIIISLSSSSSSSSSSSLHLHYKNNLLRAILAAETTGPESSKEKMSRDFFLVLFNYIMENNMSDNAIFNTIHNTTYYL
jgi:hypothetical protein